MAQAQKTGADELQELRDRVAALEAELKTERQKKDDKAENGRDWSETLRKMSTDELNRFNRGFLYAGLESLALAADITRAFVDKTYSKNESRESLTDMLTNFPRDMAEGFLDALDNSADVPRKVIDKFYDKYKEGK